MKITAHSYLRFSTPEQSQGDSERRQTKAFEDYCQRQGRIPGALAYADKGVSGFRGKNAKSGDLSRFIDAVHRGEVKPGDELVVEDFDRLSRQPPLDSIDLLSGIVKTGVVVVTLTDGKRYSRESLNDDILGLMTALMKFGRGHDESKRKTGTVGAAWKTKKDNAATKPLTAKVPGWLRLDREAGKIVPVPDRVALVKRIVKMATEGIGAQTTCQTLNHEKIPCFGHGKSWSISSLKKILRNRALVGEFQPHSRTHEGRVPYGEPVPRYYPRVVTDAQWHRLRAAVESRQTRVKGPVGKGVLNLFTGVLHCGCDGSVMTLSRKSPTRVLMSCSDGVRGNSQRHTACYSDFEPEFVRWVSELKLEEPTPDDHTEELEGRLFEVRAKIAKVQAAIIASESGSVDALVSVATRLDADAKKLAAQLDAERSKRAAPTTTEAQYEALAILKRLDGLTEPERTEARDRLSSAIGRLCRDIRVWSVGEPWERVTLCDIEFHDGRHRIFATRVEQGGNIVSAGTVNPVTPARLNFPKIARRLLNGVDIGGDLLTATKTKAVAVARGRSKRFDEAVVSREGVPLADFQKALEGVLGKSLA